MDEDKTDIVCKDDIDSTITSETDLFDRFEMAKNMVKLLKTQDLSPVIINGAWGSGKTTFCKFMIEAMGNNYPYVYVDAFKADHTGLPLLMLATALYEASTEKEKKQWGQKVWSLFKSIGAGFVPTALTSLSLYTEAHIGIPIPNLNDLADNVDAKLEKDKEASKSDMQRMFERYMDAQTDMTVLRETLSTIYENRVDPLIIIIDELDRCRPDFALQTLEKIKHLFNIKNVRFVLMANLSQLEASINHCYGEKVQASRYMNKFAKWIYSLPANCGKSDIRNVYEPVLSKYFIERVKSDHITSSLMTNNVDSFILKMFVLNSRSLRDVDQFLTAYRIFSSIEGINIPTSSPIILTSASIGVYLYCFHATCIQDFLLDALKGRDIYKKISGDLPYRHMDATYGENYQLAVVVYNLVKDDIRDEDERIGVDLLKVKITNDLNQCEFDYIGYIKQTIRTLTFLQL